MLKLIRTNSDNADFRMLVELLDEVLRESDGDDHPFYDQFNKLDKIKNAVVVYSDDIPAGCGAIKEYSKDISEIKRMYVKPDFRGQGIGKKILTALELWAAELNFSECILETGKKQTDAIRLYQSAGYEVIPNYGQYAGIDLSVCMKKILKPHLQKKPRDL
ncbi:MAG: GNAT family N-acetyltransferase [Bacteroidota bacterium]|nr:GNAT family N-acetyltransferase [Bacteroidota bacterium]